MVFTAEGFLKVPTAEEPTTAEFRSDALTD